MVVVAPDRTLLQRLAALEHANEVRSRRAQLKRDLRVGRCVVVELVAEPPAFTDSMKIMDLLLAAPKVGRVKAAKLLRLAGVSPSKTLAGLSPRQRAQLVALLEARR